MLGPGLYCSKRPPYQTRSAKIFHAEQLDLRVLRSCRQLYNECSHILWTTNTFHIGNPWTFLQFVEKRADAHKLAIRKLYLDMGQHNDFHWRNDRITSIIQSLQGLRYLYVVLSATFNRLFFNSPWILAEGDKLLHDFMEHVSSFQTLPLEKAAIVIKDIESWRRNQSPNTWPPWTTEERRRIAERVEHMLLDKVRDEAFEAP